VVAFRFPKARWLGGLVVLAVLMAGPSCRRKRFPSRGDAAAVVVVAPRHDAASPPSLSEQEPNDSPEQAQVLAINLAAPVVRLAGSLLAPAQAKGKDVDVFKLVVPGDRAVPAPVAPSVDSGSPPEDPRMRARRLSLEITTEGGAGLVVQLLDEAQKPMTAISVDAGETAGMPNIAVSPGQTYFVLLKPVAKKAKPAKPEEGQASPCTYKLTVQLADFEVADEREPNDSRETANSVTVRGSAELAGYYGWARDQDFYRIPLPEVLSALDVDLEAIDGVSASLQVLDGAGGRLAFGRGRKSERLALHNVIIRPAAADSEAASRNVFVVVRGEYGQNRQQRYVLRLTLGAVKLNAEIEPNDSPETATPVKDGEVSGYLPVGDADYFRYEAEGQRDVIFSVSFPSRVRGRLSAYRPGEAQPLATMGAKKARQAVTLPAIASLGQPVVLRVWQGKYDGNANAAYSLKIQSTLSSNQKPDSVNPPIPAPSH
jgi:hypothetical protein